MGAFVVSAAKPWWFQLKTDVTGNILLLHNMHFETLLKKMICD